MKLPLLVETSHAIPLVDVSIVAPFGALEDPVGKDGLGRLYAKLLRRGTRVRGAAAFDAAVEELGAVLSVQVGHSTFRVSGSVLRRNLAPFLSLLGEMLGAPSLSSREFAKVKRDTAAELSALADDDRSLTSRAYRGLLFGTHPLGRTVGGTTRSVARARLADVEERHALLHDRRFVVGLAGDVTLRDARKLVDDTLGPSLGEGTLDAPSLDEPLAPSRGRLVIVDKPSRTQTQIFVGGLGTRFGARDFFPLVVGNTGFGGTFTARLVHEVRSVRGWSYSASSRLYVDRVRDAWEAYAHPSEENAVACVALICELVRAYATDGLTDDETAFAKQFLAKSRAFDRDTPSKRLEPQLESAIFGTPRSFDTQFVERIGRVSARDVRRAVRANLHAQAPTVAVLGDARTLRARLEALGIFDEIRVVPHRVFLRGA